MSGGAGARTPGALSAICRVGLPEQVWGSVPLFSVPSVLSPCDLQLVGTGQVGQEEPQLAGSEAETIWCMRKPCVRMTSGMRRHQPQGHWRPGSSVLPKSLMVLSSFLGHGSPPCVYCSHSPNPGWAFCDCFPAPPCLNMQPPLSSLQTAQPNVAKPHC